MWACSEHEECTAGREHSRHARRACGRALVIVPRNRAQPALHRGDCAQLDRRSEYRQRSGRTGLAGRCQDGGGSTRARRCAAREHERQLEASFVPNRDRGVGDQHGRIREQREAEDRCAELAKTADRPQPPCHLRRRRQSDRSSKHRQHPAAHAHGRCRLEHSKHVVKAFGAPEVGDQQWRTTEQRPKAHE